MDVIAQLMIFVAWYSERTGIPMALAIERLKAMYEHGRDERLLPLVELFKREQHSKRSADAD